MNPIVEKVYQIGIIPVIAFNSVDEALPLCKALAEGGLPAAEVTFRTACAEECIRKIHEEMPEMLLGAGTVLSPTASVCARGMPSRSARASRALPLSTPLAVTSMLSGEPCTTSTPSSA